MSVRPALSDVLQVPLGVRLNCTLDVSKLSVDL